MTEPREGTGRTAEDVALPGGSFRLFVQKLSYQALIGLGVVENPVTGRQRRNLPLARGVIEDLDMLRAKTRGNLEQDEERHLDTVLENLRHHYGRLERDAEASGESP
jgi:hypothetical protein